MKKKKFKRGANSPFADKYNPHLPPPLPPEEQVQKLMDHEDKLAAVKADKESKLKSTQASSKLVPQVQPSKSMTRRQRQIRTASAHFFSEAKKYAQKKKAAEA